MPAPGWRPGCPGAEVEGRALQCFSRCTGEASRLLAGPRRGLGRPVQTEAAAETQGGLGAGRQGGQSPPAQPLLLTHPSVEEIDAPSRASVPRSPRSPAPKLGPPGKEGPARALAGALPTGLRGGDWCRQRVRPPPFGPRRLPGPGRGGARGGEGGGRGGALSAAAPPPAPGGHPTGRLGSALARERGARAPPAPTYRPPLDPHPPLRCDRRSNMAARGAPEAPPTSASGSHPPAGTTPTATEWVRPRPRPAPRRVRRVHGNGGRAAGGGRCPAAQPRAGRGRRPAEAARAEAAPFPGNGGAAGAGSGDGAGSGAMSGGAGRRRRRLVLHVDLNNTVVAADAVSGQGPRAALNTFLSTVTWGRAGAAGERRGLRGPGGGGGGG